MKLTDKEAIFTLKQRITELGKSLLRFPDSPEYTRRKVEYDTAREQLEKIKDGR